MRSFRFKWLAGLTLIVGVALLASAMLTRFGWIYARAGPGSFMLAESELRLSLFNPRRAAPTFLPQDWISSQVLEWPASPPAAWQQSPPRILFRRDLAPLEYIDVVAQSTQFSSVGPWWANAIEHPAPAPQRHWLSTTRATATNAWLGTQFTLNLWMLAASVLSLSVLLLCLGKKPLAKGFCTTCGYDCRGLPNSALCPECGAAGGLA